MRGHWSERNIPLEVRQAYANRIQDLFALPYEGKPLWLPLSPEAKEQFVAWVDQHYIATEDPGLSPFVRASYAKLKGYCPRLALIHALGVDPMATRINSSSISAACKLIDYSQEQACKVSQAIGSLGPQNIERCKAAIRRKLSVCRYSKRDVQRSVSGGAELFHTAWEELLQPEIIEHSDGSFSLLSSTYRQN